MFLGFMLGAALAAYMYLSSTALGFAFPNLNREHSIRPTFRRVSFYLCGRWLGYFLIGMIFSWLGAWFGFPAGVRLGMALSVLLGLFMLLFILVGDSPDFFFTFFLKPEQWNIPVFLKGFFSAGILAAPTLLGISLVFTHTYAGGFFFTSFFIGNSLFSLPLLLNYPWRRNVLFHMILRWEVAITAVLLIATNIFLIWKK